MSDTIGIIVPANLKYAPYINCYINILKRGKVPYKIMSWDKVGIEEQQADFVFHQKTSDSDRKKVLIGYVRFIAACKKYIRRNKINKLILLTIAPAFFLGPLFLSKYKNNFILDIRDESPFVKHFPGLFKHFCERARRVIVSSMNFNEWVPCKTLLCHNVDVSKLEAVSGVGRKAEAGRAIRIVFAGMMNESLINIEMLSQFVSSNDFEFKFIGRENSRKEAIAQFVAQNQMTNVGFSGIYEKDEIAGIYQEQADLVNIIRRKCVANRNSLPNKMYDAVLAGVPILVFEHNEAIVRYVKEYSLGIVLAEEDMNDLPKAIARKYAELDIEAYNQGRMRFVQQICMDMQEFGKVVEQFSI